VQEWLSLLQPADQLIVVENSGFDLPSALASETARAIHFVPAPQPTAMDIEKGKGYLEAQMMRHALGEARGDVVAKVTGRLQVLNFSRLRTDWPPVSARWISARLSFDLRLADSRFYVCDRQTAGAANEYAMRIVNESSGVWIEHALARFIMAATGQGYSEFVRFRRAPLVRGTSASAGIRYGGARWSARRALEHAFRRFTARSAGHWI
jgi:hypothetical protein